MKTFAFLFALAVFTAEAAHAAPARDKLIGFNGIAFGTTFEAVKELLGAGAKADTDARKNNILLDNADFFGEKFSVNHTFAHQNRLSQSYAVAKQSTLDRAVCLSRWTNLLGKLRREFGAPDSDFNKLSANIQMQTVEFKFADGSVIEAMIMGCLIQLSFLSPNAVP
jgi:hypothetical protein